MKNSLHHYYHHQDHCLHVSPFIFFLGRRSKKNGCESVTQTQSFGIFAEYFLLPFKLEWFIVMLFPYLVSLSQCHSIVFITSQVTTIMDKYIYKAVFYIMPLCSPIRKYYYRIFSSGRINTNLVYSSQTLYYIIPIQPQQRY